MVKTRTALDKFFLVIKGLCMGAANKVPGVSGGIVASLVAFMKNLFIRFRK